MKYICEIIESSKSEGSPFVKTELKEWNGYQVLAETAGQKIAIKDNEITLLNEQGLSIWVKPFKIEGSPNEVFLLKDRLLMTTYSKDYHAWGMLGPVFLLNLKDGALVAKLVGESAVTLSDGKFILGLEGYNCFETCLYDRDGKRLCEWRSYGHYIVGENDDIRVLEKDRRIPTESKLVRLKLDGEIEKGPRLNQSQISTPLVLEDKSIIFIDCGVIRIVDVDLREQYKQVLMNIPNNNSSLFISDVQFKGEQVSISIYEKNNKSSTGYVKHNWLVTIKGSIEL